MAVIKRETDYALRALVKLAEAGDFLSVSVMADAEGVPELFLRKIMQGLNRVGIVESRQGPFGGYKLARPPEEVSTLDVLEAMQGPVVINECFAGPEVCERMDFCPLRKRLVELQVEINAKLSEVTLADMLQDMAAEQGVSK